MARILYLDDEAPILKLMTRFLEILGHRVTGFTSMREALAAFEKSPADFDLVITDLSMPGASGLEFAAGIHAIRPTMPVAAASGSVNSEEAESAKAQGFLDVVPKPSSIEDMSRLITGLQEKAGVLGSSP